MKQVFNPGDTKIFRKIIGMSDTATFDSGAVHPVYATFALGRDAEWACRLFVLEMKDAKEEGIGTFLHVNHHSPALPNEEVIFTATIKQITGNEVVCTFEATSGNRRIASGETGQKIIAKEKLEMLFRNLLT